MPKKYNTKTNRNKGDRLWGKVVHHIHPTCAVRIAGAENVYGECKGHVEAHHLITRNRGGTRHSVENGVGLCTSHHKWSIDCSPHNGVLGFVEFMQICRPEQTNWWRENKHLHIIDYNYEEDVVRLEKTLDGLLTDASFIIDGDEFIWNYKGIPFRIPIL